MCRTQSNHLSEMVQLDFYIIQCVWDLRNALSFLVLCLYHWDPERVRCLKLKQTVSQRWFIWISKSYKMFEIWEMPYLFWCYVCITEILRGWDVWNSNKPSLRDGSFEFLNHTKCLRFEKCPIFSGAMSVSLRSWEGEMFETQTNRLSEMVHLNF